PRSPYAASKLAAEHLLAAWSASYVLSTVSLRYFNVFGPGQPAGSAYAAVIPAWIDRLKSGQSPVVFGDGSQTRDFTFVDNAVLATLLAGATDCDLQGEVVNVGTGSSISLNELASALAERCNKPELAPEHHDPRPGDVLHSLADISRAHKLLGYSPAVTLEAGLDATVGIASAEIGSNS
ncbi:MAG: NAD-dependent epimerase/dehydratase family protein, partial [Planctomycetota bacterium]